MALREMYRPTLDEASRQAFVGALKTYVNGPLEQQLADIYEHRIAPDWEAQHHAPPTTRADVEPQFQAEPLFQMWSSLVYTSQDLLWETSGETLDRLRPELEPLVTTLVESQQKDGELHLDGDLKLPSPIAEIEIHRQPGGYFYQARPDDITAPALYLGAVETYRAAKGLGAVGKPGEPMLGRYVASLIKKYPPDQAPTRVLDLGCANGIQTLAYAEAWPDAEIHGLDLSAPFVRFAHAWAEDQHVPIKFHQMNAADMRFPDNHFDVILSHIVCHETWDDILIDLLSETYRTLKPGGVFLSLEVPYQPEVLSMTKQVTNHWQVAHNGEPFWTGFAQTDLRALLIKAGFAEEDIISNYEPLGAGRMYAFGGWKRPR